MRRFAFLLAVAPSLAALYACSDDVLQGDVYEPDGRLPIAPASGPREAGACDGDTCDAGAEDANPLPIGDASTAPSNTCETARAFGTIAGDTGSPKATAQGTCSEWLSFRATEDSSSAVGAPMKVKLTLTPKDANFDLYVYLDTVRDRRYCGPPTASSFLPGTAADTVSLKWGEGSVANGSDDGRTVGVAVIKADGPCDVDGGSWTLVAEGNL